VHGGERHGFPEAQDAQRNSKRRAEISARSRKSARFATAQTRHLVDLVLDGGLKPAVGSVGSTSSPLGSRVIDLPAAVPGFGQHAEMMTAKIRITRESGWKTARGAETATAQSRR